MGDRGTMLMVSAQGTGTTTAAVISIALTAPTVCVGGTAGFSGVPAAIQGDPYAAAANFFPQGDSSIQIAGLFSTALIMALVNVPTGNTIAGTITLQAALPNAVTVSTAGGTYELAAGQTSGNFSFPFSGDDAAAAEHSSQPMHDA